MAKKPKPRKDGGDKTPGPLVGKRAEQAQVTPRKHQHSASRQQRPRTAEDITNEQTAEQLGLWIWAAIVGEKALSGLSALMDELIQSRLLDDDDEEGDEGWLDDHHKREKKLLAEAIAEGLEKYPD